MKIVSTNVAVPRPSGVRRYDTTGIDKQPVPFIELRVPGPNYGDGSGVVGDFVGDAEHHGGANKAVYAVAAEELAFWSAQLGRELRPGSFGENLTTSGLDLKELVLDQQVRVGTALLQVSVPRRPCGTFAQWMGERGWLKSFTQRGDCGAYFRILEPGRIAPDDAIEVLARPSHGITMGLAFRAKMGDKEAAARIRAAELR